MKIISVLLSLLAFAPDSWAANLCKNGPVNQRARRSCIAEVQRYGKIKRLDEGYSGIGFNQVSKFCMTLTNGLNCDCYYNEAPFSRQDWVNHAFVNCERPNKLLRSCQEIMKDSCN